MCASFNFKTFVRLFHEKLSDNNLFSNSSKDFQELFDVVRHDFLPSLAVRLVRKSQLQNVENVETFPWTFDKSFMRDYLTNIFFRILRWISKNSSMQFDTIFLLLRFGSFVRNFFFFFEFFNGFLKEFLIWVLQNPSKNIITNP